MRAPEGIIQQAGSPLRLLVSQLVLWIIGKQAVPLIRWLFPLSINTSLHRFPVNVACANYPLETLNVFFRYGYAIPFYNLKQVFLTIIFSTGHHYLIIKYVGILFGWAIVL